MVVLTMRKVGRIRDWQPFSSKGTIDSKGGALESRGEKVLMKFVMGLSFKQGESWRKKEK